MWTAIESLSELDVATARVLGAGRLLGIGLEAGAAGVPVRAALEVEEADGVGVGADRLTDGLLGPLCKRAALDCEPIGRILPDGESPPVSRKRPSG